MNWRDYFASQILERGRSYYRKGLVQNLEKIGDSYSAEVIGSIPYAVDILKKSENKLSMFCTCPHADDGNKCKHMAAVCFEIEEFFGEDFMKVGKASAKKKGQTAKKKDERVYPFPVKNTPESKVYTCFDLSVITQELNITQSRLEKAQEMIQKNEILLQDVKVGYKEGYGVMTLTGILNAFYVKKGASVPISIVFNTEEITYATCAVRGCNSYYQSFYGYGKKEPCVHVLAALLLLEKYIEQYNPGDNTDYEAKHLLESYLSRHQNQVVGNVVDTVNDLHFEPRLEIGWGKLLLSLRVGTNKLYVAKNLTELVQKIESGDTHTFGKNTEIDFNIHKISEESKPIYEFVRKVVNDELQRTELNQENSRYYEETTISNLIPVYGNRLDSLFELLYQSGLTVIYQDKIYGTGNRTLAAKEKTPQLTLNIDGNYDKNNVLKGIKVSGQIPNFFKGESFYYYIENEHFNRISRECTEVLSPLLEMAYDNNLEFTIGRKSLSDFYYHVMPMLSDYVEFVEKEKALVESYLPPQARFCFYLDAEHDIITCSAKAIYDDRELNLADYTSDYITERELRDTSAESDAHFHIFRYFPVVDKERGLFLCEKEEEAVFAILENGVKELLTIGEVFCTERLKRITVHKKTPVSVGVSLESGIMNLEISSEEFSNQELLDILASYRKRKKYHRLKNGDFLNMDDENLEMLADMLDSLRISSKEFLRGNIKIPAYRALYLDKILEKNKSLYVERDKHFKSLIKEFKTVSDSDFEVPVSLQKIMRNYQTNGFKWLKTLEAYGFGGILADDMGLGKTLQMISVILSAKEEKKAGTSLIVSPASLVYNWQEEFTRFAPEINTVVISGTQSARAEILKNYQAYDVLITSYDLLRRDIAEYEDKQFLYQILDEAQYIKNHTTAAAKSVKCINSKMKYALTGTPIENRLSELWSIFDYLMPGFLYGYETFRKDLETPITKNKDEEAGKRLKRMISPFILRRLKQDVLTDLPDKLEEVQYAKFESKQQKLYDAQVVHMREMLAKQDGSDFAKNKIQILAELTKLRQICCDPTLLFENFDGESAKRQACLDLIKSAMEGEHRILLFSQFTSMLALLEESLTKEGIAYYKITGSTSKEERIQLVKKFNEGEVPVFLISLKAGGTGLNLVGADVVIHYDPWWNQAVQNQATDRAHRIGQTKIVTVYKLIAKGTIEEKIVKLQESKKNLADEILSGENGGLAQLSKEELLELL